MSKTPSVRITGRVTRSMVDKANTVKPYVKDSKDIEMIVLDDQEYGPVPHDFVDMDLEPVTHPAENIPHIPNICPHRDSVPDSQIKGKPAKGVLAGAYQFSETVHPLFVNHLLDKLRCMEMEIKEVVALNDFVKAENMRLQANFDSADKRIQRLKQQKKLLMRKVQKFYRKNHKNEERIREINAQVALMQLKGSSQAPFSQIPTTGVNIQVYNTPVRP